MIVFEAIVVKLLKQSHCSGKPMRRWLRSVYSRCQSCRTSVRKSSGPG
ncbi:hypothetical protein C5Q22_000429 [Salmonella enterica subsp. enterica serovar Typhimurium]|nr:hypothetical protein [Salmonella enterica subsp. enterica serovar Typhimurium]